MKDRERDTGREREREIIKKVSERCDEEQDKYFWKRYKLRGHFDCSQAGVLLRMK
jgi:hypothetical protein